MIDMKKAEKKLQKWQKLLPADVRKDEGITVVDYYFESNFTLDNGRGSHQIKIIHPALDNEYYFYNHTLIIPVSNGRRIKRTYINKLLIAIDLKEGSDHDRKENIRRIYDVEL